MSTEVSIFKADLPAAQRSTGVSALTASLSASDYKSRRISIKGGFFRKVVNGEEVAKLKDREMNVIIINALPKVSRQFYAAAYNPKADATLPDCWSNLGDVPDAKAANPQAANCMSCPQNVAGSGQGGGRACRYQRRVAVLLENDPSGDVYQLTIPSKSLFGKGEGNVHPFESYIKFLAANNESIDRVVTQISFDDNEESPTLQFTPVRHLLEEEVQLATEAAGTTESKNAVVLTVAAQDKVKKLANAEAEFETVKKAAPVEAEEVTAEDEPKVRASRKEATPQPKQDLTDVLDAWADK
jgi:hypothetical protein